MAIARPADRLDFDMPPFWRVLWSSDAARSAWDLRLARIRTAWAEAERCSVLESVRPCAAFVVPAMDLAGETARWASLGLSLLPLAGRNDEPGIPPSFYQVVLGALQDGVKFQKAHAAGDCAEMDRLLGYPSCCAAFYAEALEEAGGVDLTWEVACNTIDPVAGAQRIDIRPPAALNLLAHTLRIRAVPHLPCRFDCGASVALSATFSSVAAGAGYAEEMRWRADVLSWPMEWSMLHGIAELKTPILKAATAADPTATKYTVRFLGSSYPPEAARGLGFPYRTSPLPMI